jgi:hypothetical protein
VYARQVTVEHHHVVPGHRGVLECVMAVQRDVDRHALATQPGPERARQNLVVFDDKDSHADQGCQGTGHGTGTARVTGL